MAPKRYTHIRLDEIFSRAIKDIKIVQLGKPEEMIISINYHPYIYEIEDLIKEEIEKAIKSYENKN